MNLSMPPKVQECISALSAERQRCECFAVDLERTEGAVRAAGAEVEQIRARIAEREAELARGEGVIPLEAFPEDGQLARAERQHRILTLRLNAARERLQGSQAEIERLKKAIEAAWLEWGKQEHARALQAFEEAAVNLRDLLITVTVFDTAFPSLRLGVPQVVAGRLSCAEQHDPFSVPEAFISTGDPVWRAKNDPRSTELFEALRIIGNEIERAKFGDGARDRYPTLRERAAESLAAIRSTIQKSLAPPERRLFFGSAERREKEEAAREGRA